MPFDRADEDELYQEHILDHYEDPFHRGSCPHTTHAHEDDNPLCGDVVRIELDVDAAADKIQDAYFNGDGCCISQASASMLVEHVTGKSLEEVRNFKAEDMLALFGAKLTPNRQKCCLLSWRVLQQAIYSPTAQATTAEPLGPPRTLEQADREDHGS
ncbi:MAG: iron-sulfur cluster assembly scaffold protein [Planctomycetales bacterium]|jgi:nitrogen fixation NifU-like protein|nr:iron-sulfur cluster assembly scaffold protein [Planctomycetales bacterium]MBN8628008.1 iron-sulfur cluster assembly scaffold protein [Planctomycetota bacterium]